jgi:hypothetical protein
LEGSVIDEGALQKSAREAIQTGKLPDRSPSRILGGNGFGTHCPVCSNLVNADEIGYELQFAEWDGHPGTVEYHLHVRCFSAWDQECRRRLGLTAAVQPLPAEPGGVTISDRERLAYKR